MSEPSNCEACGGEITQTSFYCRQCKTLTPSVQAKVSTSGTGERVEKAVILVSAWLVLLIIVGTLIAGIAWLTDRPDSSEIQRREADKLAGLHCIGGGYNSYFIEAVKKRLRDPSSFEHAETRIDPVIAGSHRVAMKFRSRNGFGGMTVQHAIGTIDHATCSDVAVTLIG